MFLFTDDKRATQFGREFIDRYAATAFGVLPKSEIDLLVFFLLVESRVIDPNGSIYRIARALDVTPAKARTLLFRHQLRHVSEAETDHAVMIALTIDNRLERAAPPATRSLITDELS